MEKDIFIAKDKATNAFGFSMQTGFDNRCFISDIFIPGPAYRMGLCIGDEIITFSGKYVYTFTHSEMVVLIQNSDFIRMRIKRSNNDEEPPSYQSSLYVERSEFLKLKQELEELKRMFSTCNGMDQRTI